MSSLFYDHLLDTGDLEKSIKKHVEDPKDREEIMHLIDEIIHHRVMGAILDRLPSDHHTVFISKVAEKPHDQSIVSFLTERIAEDVSTFIRHEIYVLVQELLLMIEPPHDK